MRVEDIETFNFDKVGTDLQDAYAEGYNDGYAYAKEETVRELIDKVKAMFIGTTYNIDWIVNKLEELAKQCGVEVEE